MFLAGTARAATSAPAPTSSFLHGCAGEMAHTSTSITDDNGRQRWTIKLEGTSCRIDFRMEGEAQFNDDFTDLVSLPPGGSFRLDVTDDGQRRQLDITPGSGGLERIWKVNGRVQPYDDAARAWLGAFLIELDRRTGVAVDQRLPILLRKGGVAGVLAETAQMPSDYARNVYYSKLAAATRLSNADLVRVIDQAVSLGTSDYYNAELLKKLDIHPADDAQVRAAVVRMLRSMKSDYYRAESVRLVAASRDATPDEVRALIDAASTMESDYYLSESVNAILANSNLTDADLLAIVKAVAPTKSEYYKTEMLRHVLAHRAVTEPVRRAALDAADGMSGYYREELEKASRGR
jgi:hypothetical protein